MQKAHSNIDWENYPSYNTPINESNLNKMDRAIDEIDNRVINFDISKFDTADAQLLVKALSFDRATGTFTVTHVNGTSYTIDTLLEKIAVNFDFDVQTQQLIIILDDDTKKYVDLSALITIYEFLDSDTIQFTINANGKVTASIKEGSIQEKHLRPDYLADIRVVQARAQTNASDALASAELAKKYAEDVSNDKAQIEQTINDSLLASSKEILDSVQDYLGRAEAKYSSMYYDCDGETPHARSVTIITIDGGTPKTRAIDAGIDFDGGTPMSRLLPA